jgi:hypothetical protein
MHGSTGGDWKRSKELDHGRWGGTADRETGGTKAPGPTVRRSHRASPRPYMTDWLTRGAEWRKCLTCKGNLDLLRVQIR